MRQHRTGRSSGDVVMGAVMREKNAGLLVSFFFEFCRCVNILCFFWNEDSLLFKRAFVFLLQIAEKVERRLEWEFAMAGRSGFSSSSEVRVDFFKPQTFQHW